MEQDSSNFTLSPLKSDNNICKPILDLEPSIQHYSNNLHQEKLFTKIHISENFLYVGYVDEDYIPHGYGTISYPNGDKYTGDFIKGKKNGQGEYFCQDDGTTYKGFWENDKRQGKAYVTGFKRDDNGNEIIPRRQIYYVCQFDNDKIISCDIESDYDPTYDLEDDEFFNEDENINEQSTPFVKSKVIDQSTQDTNYESDQKPNKSRTLNVNVIPFLLGSED